VHGLRRYTHAVHKVGEAECKRFTEMATDITDLPVFSEGLGEGALMYPGDPRLSKKEVPYCIWSKHHRYYGMTECRMKPEILMNLRLSVLFVSMSTRVPDTSWNGKVKRR